MLVPFPHLYQIRTTIIRETGGIVLFFISCPCSKSHQYAMTGLRNATPETDTPDRSLKIFGCFSIIHFV